MFQLGKEEIYIFKISFCHRFITLTARVCMRRSSQKPSTHSIKALLNKGNRNQILIETSRARNTKVSQPPTPPLRHRHKGKFQSSRRGGINAVNCLIISHITVCHYRPLFRLCLKFKCCKLFNHFRCLCIPRVGHS